MTNQVSDVLEAVQSFVSKGYDREYRVKEGRLVDLELGSTLDACAIQVDAALRLESGDDAEDASNIYAITDPTTQHKGLLIDAFDVFDEICHRDLASPQGLFARQRFLGHKRNMGYATRFNRAIGSLSGWNSPAGSRLACSQR
ncbi:hypothetical protein ACQKO5_20950 [Novosphingobium subterraneum]|uniref:hypothetical protein n=1 Tax=Novosphingobium subterraneum TaxID=48936 RepID=UPI003D0212BD